MGALLSLLSSLQNAGGERMELLVNGEDVRLAPETPLQLNTCNKPLGFGESSEGL